MAMRPNLDSTPFRWHRGIAGPLFQRRLEFASCVMVTSACRVDDLLIIDLKRETPEAMKPQPDRTSTHGLRQSLSSLVPV